MAKEDRQVWVPKRGVSAIAFVVGEQGASARQGDTYRRVGTAVARAKKREVILEGSGGLPTAIAVGGSLRGRWNLCFWREADEVDRKDIKAKVEKLGGLKRKERRPRYKI